jgi:hypothetical protein
MRTVDGSDAYELREVIEVPVSSVQREVVLKDHRREPHVVGWNRRALFSQLTKDGRVVMRRLIVGEEHVHAVFERNRPRLRSLST